MKELRCEGIRILNVKITKNDDRSGDNDSGI